MVAAVFGSPPCVQPETSAREPTLRSMLPFVGYRNVVGPTPAGARDEAAGPRTRGASCGERSNNVPAPAHAGDVGGTDDVVVAAGAGMVAVVVALVVVAGVLTVVSTDVVAGAVVVVVVVVGSVVAGSVAVVAAVVVGTGVVSAMAVPAHAAAAITPSATAFQIS